MADEEREFRFACKRTGSFVSIKTGKDAEPLKDQIPTVKLEAGDIQEVCLFRFGEQSCPADCPVNNIIKAQPDEIIAEIRRLTQEPVPSTPGDQLTNHALS